MQRTLLLPLARTLGITLLGSAAYGYALGSAHSELYALRHLLKFPLLISVTGAVCTPSYWIVARTCGAPLSFASVQRRVWSLFRDGALLLASLAPVIYFLARVARSTDDGELGEYDSFLALNIACVAGVGALALARQMRELVHGQALSLRLAGVLVCVWLALSSAVGGQAAFYMRPFFGFPATRGNVPPWFLGPAPDLRGATNFYEAVWQTLRAPRVERWPWETY
jgi:hypothetical protein